MPTPESTLRDDLGPVAAVRAVLDALAVPAARQALLLEQALAAQMAVFTRAPAAADFDPLARTPALAAPRVARPLTGTVRRKAAPAKPAEPGADLAGIGTAVAAVVQAATQPPPAQSMLTGLAAVVAALTAPDGASPRRPSPPALERAAHSVALGTLGAVAQTAGAAAKALDPVPGTGATAPVLERIAEIGGVLWLQMALAPPAHVASSGMPVNDGAVRSVPAVAHVSSRAASAGAAASNSPPTNQAGAAQREATSPVETVTDTLAGIGRLTVELFGAAARAGTPDLPGAPARPAPRAPNVLAPERAPEPTSRPSGGSPASAAPGVTVDVDPDALARALRAEAELRGVAL